MTPGGSPLGPLAPLSGRRWSRVGNVVLVSTTESTNDVAKALVEKLTSEGEDIAPTAVVSARQTAGRGRGGRPWLAVRGTSLAVSLIAPWPEGPGRVSHPVRVGIELARGLTRAFGLTVGLKWPNDLLVGRRKVGGILVEARSAGEEGSYVVTGVGLNLAMTREALDEAGLPGATSFAAEGAPPGAVEFEAAADAVLSTFDEFLAEGTDLGDLAAAFESVTVHRPGDALTVRDADRTASGRYAGVTAEGFLRLTADGAEATLVSGDVASF